MIGKKTLGVLLIIVLTFTIVVIQHQAMITNVSDRASLQFIAQQRDNISQQLNLLQERHQQLICKMKGQSNTSETGGWCNSAVVGSFHVTDKRLVNALVKLFTNRTVVGLGDGRGEYRKLILRTGKVLTYDAYDGSPNISSITNGQVQFLDLTLSQYWLRRYDWVLSLEVIEHIPAKFQKVVLDNIDRAAGHGIVLSWANVGQGGFYHVNNRSPAYVNKTMTDRGFRMDQNITRVLRGQATLLWLRTNIMVFIRK